MAIPIVALRRGVVYNLAEVTGQVTGSGLASAFSNKLRHIRKMLSRHDIQVMQTWYSGRMFKYTGQCVNWSMATLMLGFKNNSNG